MCNYHPDYVEEMMYRMDTRSTPQRTIDNYRIEGTRADPEECVCGGRGWWYSPYDSVHKCNTHYNGQPHPELDIDLLYEPTFASYEDYMRSDTYLDEEAYQMELIPCRYTL